MDLNVTMNKAKTIWDFEISDVHDNIVTEAVVKDLFDNFDEIPMEKLQDFINQFKK